VQVAYAYPGAAPARELVCGGRAIGTQDPAAMRRGGRVPRLEEAEVILHIEVSRPGATPREVEERAEEIAVVVVELLAGDPQLSNQSGLLFAGVSRVELEPAEFDDDGATANLTLGVALKSFLK